MRLGQGSSFRGKKNKLLKILYAATRITPPNTYLKILERGNDISILGKKDFYNFGVRKV